MADRISTELMTLLEQSLDRIENEYRPTCEQARYGSGCAGATDASLDFWRRAVDAMPALLAEIRERRAADLSAEDVEALRWLRSEVSMIRFQHSAMGLPSGSADRALAALSRLLGDA